MDLASGVSVLPRVLVLWVPFATSHHYSIKVSIKSGLFHSKVSLGPHSFLSYTRANFDGIVNFLLDWDFSPCFQIRDVDFIWSQIMYDIDSPVTNFVPMTFISKSHSPA